MQGSLSRSGANARTAHRSASSRFTLMARTRHSGHDGSPCRPHALRVPPTRVINSDGISSGENYVLANGVVDYYAVIGVDDDAEPEEIQRAYRTLAKSCHPDISGDEEGHDLCVLLNEAYDVLSNPDERAAYNAKLEAALADFEDDYTGRPLSKWIPQTNPKMAKNEDPMEDRAVFVDEFSCIGCKMCVWCASATFRMENEHGRSRVFAQWLDTEDKIQQSIDSCPVSCIHWVKKDDLAPLEYVTQVKLTERSNVAVMMGGSVGNVDVFQQTAVFMKERKQREESAAAQAKQYYSAAQQQARRRAADALKQKKSGWMPNMEDLLANAFAGIGGVGPGAYVGEDKASKMITRTQVGKRRRAVRWDNLEQQQAMSSIPLERALVPVSYYNE